MICYGKIGNFYIDKLIQKTYTNIWVCSLTNLFRHKYAYHLIHPYLNYGILSRGKTYKITVR